MARRQGARSHATPALLVEAAEEAGSALARQAALLVRRGAESPMETKVRLLLMLAGFPEPRVQLTLTGRDGHPRYRLDLSYPELRVAIEDDGRHHAEDPGQWGHDLGRREWLDGRGWRVIVVRSPDVQEWRVSPGRGGHAADASSRREALAW